MDIKYIKRGLFDRIKEHMKEKEITLLVGPRQVGKTTLLKKIDSDLQCEGHKTLFLNLDIEADRQFLTSQEALVSHIKIALGVDRGYIFIDEAQRKEDAGRFFKGIYDMGLPYKFILSGSGSLELKEKIHESMAGRKRVFELLPVTFFEFADFRTDYLYENRLVDFFSNDAIRTESFFNEYMRFGGYPGVILADSEEKKLQVLSEIYQSYLMRDISFLLGVEKTNAFSTLVRLLSSRIGNLTATSALAADLGISNQTVKQYLWYLEKTYIVHRLSPYVRNARKEITKMPIYYFYDSGMRNLALNFSNDVLNTPEGGFLFENFVFSFLYEHFGPLLSPLHFWRSKGGAEVDFVIDRGSGPIPCEVKLNIPKRVSAGRSLLSFIELYKPKRAFIVTRRKKANMRVGKTEVEIMPFYELPEKLR